MNTEIVGYVGSALVVLSLTMTSVVRLRIVSFAGSLTFGIYGALIGSIPIMLTNSAILLINSWFLAREFSLASARGRDLGASRIRADSPFLLDFIEYHHHDIEQFQPAFTMPTGDDVVAFVLTRDGLPAGLLIGRRDDDQMMIDLDYVLAAYRDSRLGQWLFGPGAAVLRAEGIRTLMTEGTTATHARYLERVGFEREGDRLRLTL